MRERAVSISVIAKPDIEIFLYSTAVQASRQTVNVFLSLTAYVFYQ